MNAPMKATQIRVNHFLPAYWRVTFDNPPLNLMGPEFVLQFRDIMAAIETDKDLKVVVFGSAVDGFLNHSDFLGKLEDLTGIPRDPTGLEAWEPDILVRGRRPGHESKGYSNRASTSRGTRKIIWDSTLDSSGRKHE